MERTAVLERDQAASAEAGESARKSFDIMASVNLFRHDLAAYGRVLPETRQRAYDEELTFIAEGINRPLDTVFRLREVDGDLCYFSEGQWRPYVGTLLTGLETANREAQADRRLTFMADRAADDLAIGYRLTALPPGGRMHWQSRFPRREHARYGTGFIQARGFQAVRQMGFLYEAERLDDGSLLLRSMSIDGDDDEGFEAVGAAIQTGAGLDGQRDAYDAALTKRTGVEHFAGRPHRSAVPEENAWTFIRQHQDLIGFYLDRLEGIARDHRLPEAGLIKAKKRLTYGVWAALKERLDSPMKGAQTLQHGPVLSYLGHEIDQAFTRASMRGDVLLGCGGKVTGDAMLGADPKDVFDMIWGGEGKEEDRIPSVIRCIKCRQSARKEKVIKAKSWCCPNPKCRYEIDICTGRVLKEAGKTDEGSSWYAKIMPSIGRTAAKLVSNEQRT